MKDRVPLVTSYAPWLSVRHFLSKCKLQCARWHHHMLRHQLIYSGPIFTNNETEIASGLSI